MKKIFCLGLIGMLSFGATSFTKVISISQAMSNAYVQGIQITAQPEVKVSTKEVKDSEEAYKINLQIPVLEGIQDTKIQTSINIFIEKDALAFAEEIKGQGLESATYSRKQGWVVRPYEASTSYKVTYNQKNIVSIACTYYRDTLGAHGNSETKTFNFDLNTGKQLTLKDLFDENENYLSAINGEIQKQIKLNPTEYFSKKDQGFVSIRSDQPFGIEDGNVIIYFDPYEIAPYSTGAPQFKLPFSLFKGGVKIGAI